MEPIGTAHIPELFTQPLVIAYNAATPHTGNEP